MPGISSFDRSLGSSAPWVLRRRPPWDRLFRHQRREQAGHVQSSGREEAIGANVLVAIFAERESPAAYFLREQG
jgi:hypothetical protein